MNWEITIKRVDNGFLLTAPANSEDETATENIVEFLNREVSTEEEDEQNTVKRMLTKVAEYFGYNYDKWSKTNLKISWDDKGHKVYDEEED